MTIKKIRKNRFHSSKRRLKLHFWNLEILFLQIRCALRTTLGLSHSHTFASLRYVGSIATGTAFVRKISLLESELHRERKWLRWGTLYLVSDWVISFLRIYKLNTKRIRHAHAKKENGKWNEQMQKSIALLIFFFFCPRVWVIHRKSKSWTLFQINDKTTENILTTSTTITMKWNENEQQSNQLYTIFYVFTFI